MQASKRRCIIWNVAICLVLVLTSCCACAHMAEHGCSYYENCTACHIFESVAKLTKLAALPLLACVVISLCMRAISNTALRSIFSATLVARFVQLND